MKHLQIKASINEETRLGTVILHFDNDGAGCCYDLYCGMGDDHDKRFVTKKGNPNEILMMCTEDLWNAIFEDYPEPLEGKTP